MSSTDINEASDGMDTTMPINFSVNKYGETVCKAIEEASRKSAEAEEMIGRYRKRRLIGQGTFGTVHLAYDDQLEREVAIKIPLARLIAADKGETRDLFLREARQLARVSHPNIVTIHDVGLTDEVCFVVSEFVAGPDLNRWMQDNFPTWMESAQMVAAIADGLAAAHSEGVIHRDVKPANIIISERTEGAVPILCDFGLAISEATAGSSGTRRGDISGTPNFMSPEQARGEGHRIDGRTDIYSLGVVLYRMLTGQLPFAARNLADLLEEITDAEARPPRQFVQGLPRELEEICLKAIAKKIPDRYTAAGDLAEDLRALLKAQETKPPPPVVAATKTLPAPSGAMRILIAEDNEVTRVKLQADLEKWGHEVVAAENGQQAWEYFQNDNFSMVLTDWMMPVMDGIDLVKRIRASGRGSYAYLIMLTAKAERHDIVLGMGAGADDFLAKPYHRDELNVRLRAGKRVVDMTRAISRTSRRMERGVRAAAEIQRSFLPKPGLEIPGLKLAWEYCPCDELGGDMLGVVPLDANHVGFYILDVNGSGVPASLLATNVSRSLGAAADPASILVDHDSAGGVQALVEPEEVARRLNQQFSGNPEVNQYFTLSYGILNRETLEFRYTCAGHPPLLHQSRGEAPIALEGFGLPIGVTADNDDYHQETVVLKPGDRLFFYTNGLVATPNAEDELYGRDRLSKVIEDQSQSPLKDVPGAVLSEVREFGDHSELSDDVTVLAVEIE